MDEGEAEGRDGGSLMADPAARALAEAAMTVARRRAKVLDRMKAALLAGDSEEALRLARVLTGLEEDEPAEVQIRRKAARRGRRTTRLELER